jgi:hypothetical protein
MERKVMQETNKTSKEDDQKTRDNKRKRKKQNNNKSKRQGYGPCTLLFFLFSFFYIKGDYKTQKEVVQKKKTKKTQRHAPINNEAMWIMQGYHFQEKNILKKENC